MIRLCLLAALPACALAADDGSAVEQDTTSTTYVDIADFQNIDQGQWFAGIDRLRQAFVAPNVVPLSFGCAVTSKAGYVRDCAWTLGAAAVAVDPTTAAIAVDAPTFQCHVTM